MKFNYSIICARILRDLPKREKDVISRRFGLRNGEKETLESIGDDYGVTRERVRQIERNAFTRMKTFPTAVRGVTQYFNSYLKSVGGLKRESQLLEELGGKKEKNQVHFLFSLAKNIERYGETETLHALWVNDKKALSRAPKVINTVAQKLNKGGTPLTIGDLNKIVALNKKVLDSYLGASKKVQRNSNNLYGLKEWPEINPRGIKDKAYLVFKKENKPLHFNNIAGLIEAALPQTVHNELIKDNRFVLVGRGLYALSEWGYQSGYVKDIIANVLKESKKPLDKSKILTKVLKQRLVKKNTVFLNLSNKKYFTRTPKGQYTTRET